MLLVVDVGNTQTHFGTFRGEDLVEHWRFATVRSSTADELGAAFANLLDLRGLSFIDSSGLHLLVALHQRAQRDGFQLALVAPTPPVDRALQVSGLDKTLPFVSPSAIE